MSDEDKEAEAEKGDEKLSLLVAVKEQPENLSPPLPEKVKLDLDQDGISITEAEKTDEDVPELVYLKWVTVNDVGTNCEDGISLDIAKIGKLVISGDKEEIKTCFKFCNKACNVHVFVVEDPSSELPEHVVLDVPLGAQELHMIDAKTQEIKKKIPWSKLMSFAVVHEHDDYKEENPEDSGAEELMEVLEIYVEEDKNNVMYSFECEWAQRLQQSLLDRIRLNQEIENADHFKDETTFNKDSKRRSSRRITVCLEKLGVSLDELVRDIEKDGGDTRAATDTDGEADIYVDTTDAGTTTGMETTDGEVTDTDVGEDTNAESGSDTSGKEEKQQMEKEGAGVVKEGEDEKERHGKKGMEVATVEATAEEGREKGG
jgi:hypothetical protein